MNALMAFKVVLASARGYAGGHQDCLKIHRACRLVEEFARTATKSVRGSALDLCRIPRSRRHVPEGRGELQSSVSSH